MKDTKKYYENRVVRGGGGGDYFSLSFCFSLVIKFLLCEMNTFLEIHSTTQYLLVNKN